MSVRSHCPVQRSRRLCRKVYDLAPDRRDAAHENAPWAEPFSPNVGAHRRISGIAGVAWASRKLLGCCSSGVCVLPGMPTRKHICRALGAQRQGKPEAGPITSPIGRGTCASLMSRGGYDAAAGASFCAHAIGLEKGLAGFGPSRMKGAVRKPEGTSSRKVEAANGPCIRRAKAGRDYRGRNLNRQANLDSGESSRGFRSGVTSL